LHTTHQTKDDIEQELRYIEKAKSNPEDFAPLYEKYYRQIFLFIYKRTDDEDISGDLVSQVFMKALLHIKKYEFRGLPFSAWLYRIASNEINMHIRAKKLERAIHIENVGLERLTEEVESEPDLEKENLVMETFNELSTDEIQYLELRFFENKSFKEVGYILNVTENNAKVKTYRILDKIKKIIHSKKHHQK
jgi:RNA polymerase sigma-70 factor, ECF subfamily